MKRNPVRVGDEVYRRQAPYPVLVDRLFVGVVVEVCPNGWSVRVCWPDRWVRHLHVPGFTAWHSMADVAVLS